jgi:hypothetical protein
VDFAHGFEPYERFIWIVFATESYKFLLFVFLASYSLSRVQNNGIMRQANSSSHQARRVLFTGNGMKFGTCPFAIYN